VGGINAAAGADGNSARIKEILPKGGFCNRAQVTTPKDKEIDMPTPIEIITEFCAALSEDGGRPAVRRWFTPETVWVNEGISRTTGIDEAIGMIDELEKSMGIATVHVDMLAIAADGNRVLTERLDRFERADGSEMGRVTLMGIFELEGDRIVAWRDYVDVNAVSKLAGG
jgi:limonene-1,2-epoxide hydrolase